jgi:UDP-glucose 4-epimerase
VIDVARRITGHAIPARIEPPRPGDPAILLADPSRARQLLGWLPAHSGLQQMVSSAWAWQQRVPAPQQIML